MKKRAFTLVELMVVVAIIGLLTTMIVSSCNKKTITTRGTGEILYQSSKEVTLPESVGYVTDTINLLDVGTKRAIEESCKNFDSIAQIAILIVDTVKPLSIEDYEIRLAEKWKVGHAGKDDGVILLVAKDDRELRIGVGRGLESKLPDSLAGRIIEREIVPYFKDGKFSEGVANGVYAIQREVSK